MLYFNKNKEAYHIGVKNGDVGKYVILTGDPKRCENIAKNFSNSKKVGDSREFITYTGEIDGEKVSVSSTGIGGPSAAISITELVEAGGRVFIRVGTCGGMSLRVAPGDLIIPTGSIRKEGTTKEYAPIEYPAVPDFDVTRRLIEYTEKNKIKSHYGVVESKDSFYGQLNPDVMPISKELNDSWNAYLKLGNCKASEMETAALFIVGAFLKVKVGAVLLAIHNQERADAGINDNPDFDIEKAVKVAVSTIKEMIKDKFI